MDEQARDQQRLQARVDRELGRVPNVQRQRRHPLWLKRARVNQLSRNHAVNQERLRAEALRIILEILRSNPQFEVGDDTRSFVFKHAAEI
jgi:hypothetical protein